MAPKNPRGSSPEVAFVLPGGGSAGAVQVGILHSLVAAGIFPDLLVGCSVGALNAAFFALDPTLAQVDRLAELWAVLSTKAVFGGDRHRALVRLIRRRDHVWSPGPLRQLIRQCCPIDDLAELTVAMQVVTTDLDLGVSRWWSHGPAQEVLYASACLPGLLPPALLDGHRHVDGGVLEPVPVRRAVDLDAQTVYVLGDAMGPDDEPNVAMSALDVLVRSFAISRYGRLPDPVTLARAGQQVIVVPGADTAGVAITDFSHTEALQRESMAVSRRFLSAQGPVPAACAPGGDEVLGAEQHVERRVREGPHEGGVGKLRGVGAKGAALRIEEPGHVDNRGDARPGYAERHRPIPGLLVEVDPKRRRHRDQRPEPVAVEGGPENS